MNKLVRDNIICKIQSENPDILEYHNITDDIEFQKALINKIVEEANELKNAKNIDDMYEELGDLFEVTDALYNLLIKIDPSSFVQIHDKREIKSKLLGKFDDRCFIDKYQATKDIDK